jgi:hypothetical protein
MPKPTTTPPRPYKTIFRVDYKPQLKFYNLLINAAQQFSEYPHWQTTALNVTLRDFDRKCSLIIRHNSFSYQQDLDDNPDYIDYINKAITRLPELLEIPSCTRLGFRRKYLIATKLDFSELVRTHYIKLISQDERLIKLLPKKLEDTSYRINCSEDNLTFHILVGPVKKQEIPQHLELDRENHFNPKSRDRDYNVMIKSLPNVATYFDLDIFRTEDDIPLSDATTFFAEASDRIQRMVIGFEDYLFEKEMR